ncbi:hypothetical protein GUITHDRAFT_143986 [Guillardia theta CCMP2712]|uniref:Uncharacterized protein n=1 Tax=Guillardia theta (strain CCMP2712) TaxID=905079 RepID=L1ISE6_GUITC|nr:hypothetical protein GUITHDRAFT_143986 [Guillardia theta CCMP2712]EKX38799.1 hypothetical protein GUITHDRAFT_143986 [Guillardia theta CCMP2712]|eukprot:XP_005825779.1 hypothetical protein GUITHDRAFT_143986 [Guillardia theta CCMP2712]
MRPSRSSSGTILPVGILKSSYQNKKKTTSSSMAHQGTQTLEAKQESRHEITISTKNQTNKTSFSHNAHNSLTNVSLIPLKIPLQNASNSPSPPVRNSSSPPPPSPFLSSPFRSLQAKFLYPSRHKRLVLRPPFMTRLREMMEEDIAPTGLAYVAWDRQRFKSKGGRYWRGSRVKPGTDPRRINKIWIWGERSSCTTLMTELIRQNFRLGCGDPGGDECVIGGLPWKHGYLRHAGTPVTCIHALESSETREEETRDQSEDEERRCSRTRSRRRAGGDLLPSADVRHQAQTLNLLVTRSPYEWVESMHRHPFYAEVHNNLDMSTFLAREWVTFEDSSGIVSASYDGQGRWGRGDNVVPCDRARSRFVPGAACAHQGREYTCVELPGLRANAPLLAGLSVSPHESCLPPSHSSAVCGERFLCTGLDSDWLSGDEDARRWRRSVSDYILESAGEVSRAREAGVGLPGLSSPDLECLAVSNYQVQTRLELAPSPSCYDGEGSWGRCREGKFLCHAKTPRHWDVSPQAWEAMRRQLQLASLSVQRRMPGAQAYDPPLTMSEKWEDRDPDTKRRFPNILAMRAAKLRDWFLVADEKLDFSSHVACRDFFIDPIKVLARLERDFKLVRKHSSWQLSQCMMHFGVASCPNGFRHAKYEWDSPQSASKRRYYTHGEYARAFSPTTLKQVGAWLDEELEGALGYRVYEDLQTLSRPYTGETRCEEHRPRAKEEGMECYGDCRERCRAG